MIEEKHKTKIGTFYLDTESDVNALEAILNSPACQVIKETEHRLKDDEKQYEDGKMISCVSNERIYIVLRYIETTIKE